MNDTKNSSIENVLTAVPYVHNEDPGSKHGLVPPDYNY